MNRKQLYDTLRQSDARITFTKVDGTVRVMDASLRDQHVAPEYRAATLSQLETDATTLRVYSIKDKGFRSVIAENVTNVEVLA